MRRGLRPLYAHLGLAASLQDAEGSVLLRSAQEFQGDIEAMLAGIRRYQEHGWQGEELPLDIFWQEGTVTVRSIPGHAAEAGGPVVLLVPSMVNGSQILDLLPGRSLLRWLAEQGTTPFLLDWGEGVQDPGQATIDAIVLDRLAPAIRAVAAEAEGRGIHALGYCMGGTLLAGAAVHVKEHLKSVIFLAAPWDFHAGPGMLLNKVKFFAPSAFPMIHEKGFLPVDWIQTLFAALDPHSAAKKFAAFNRMTEGSDEEKLFVAVEDWLNDGPDLPAQVAQQCLKDWFIGNQTGRGEWTLRGRAVDPADIACPALVIASDKDRLVEYETAAALAKHLKSASLHNPSCGHVGMIAGRGAVEKVWKPIAAWVQQNA